MVTGASQRFYGNLKDSDRIFTNLYKDQTPFMEGALKRVRRYLELQIIHREIGTGLRTSLAWVLTGLLTKSRLQVLEAEEVQVSPLA